MTIEQFDQMKIDLKLKPYVFRITPKGKIRMTQGDKYWQSNLRSSNTKRRNRANMVKKYFDYKDALNILALKNGYRLDDYCIIESHIPIPPSYRKNKKKVARLMEQKIHQVKPDADNILKGFKDCLAANGDSHIWFDLSVKVYTMDTVGQIIAYL